MLGWQVAFNLAQGVLGDYNKRVGLAPRWMFMTVTILELYRKKTLLFTIYYIFISLYICLFVQYVQPFQVQSKISQQLLTRLG